MKCPTKIDQKQIRKPEWTGTAHLNIDIIIII
jgi:hypothetical protein